MCNTDYDYPRFYHMTYRKAKKLHSCCECGRTIKKGEKYQYVCGGWDDAKVSTFKTCKYCVVAQNWLHKECGGFMHGGLQEEIEEHAWECRKIFLYKWLIGIRTKWIHMNSLWRDDNECKN